MFDAKHHSLMRESARLIAASQSAVALSISTRLARAKPPKLHESIMVVPASEYEAGAALCQALAKCGIERVCFAVEQIQLARDYSAWLLRASQG